MTQSTDGQICYGILLDMPGELPWDKEEWGWDIEHWWVYSVNGYKNPFEIYTPDGSYVSGTKPTAEEIDAFFLARRKFLEAYPLPVELVNSADLDDPMYILAAPSIFLYASCGSPIPFNPSDLCVDPAITAMLTGFCQAHGIEHAGRPQWWLSCYAS